MLRAFIPSLLLTLLAAPAPAAAQLVNENLLVVMPTGYKIGFQTKKNNMDMSEMVPSNQTVDDWTEMVTVQIFHGMTAPPEQFKGTLEQRWSAACPNSTSAPIASAVENGYATLVWLFDCPHNPATGKPEITWFKAVQGNDSFYLVQKAFKFAPSKDQVVQWTKYLNVVQVCDSRLPDRACPQVKN
jgi:hypothetical protein